MITENHTIFSVLPSGIWHPLISYIFNKFRSEVLHFRIIYHVDGGSTFLRIVWYCVLDYRMSQHIFSQISQNYTEFMKAICLPYLSLADFCRHSCRISLRIQSVGDQTQNTLCWDRSACTAPLFSNCVACKFLT
jgi:hypothetical protein